jgi:hypothetical protein
MTDPIPLIMSLTGCTQEEAQFAYNEKGDAVDAIEDILNRISPLPKSVTLSNPRKRKREDMTPEEEEVEKLRPTMELMNREIESKITSNQRVASSEAVTRVPREETVLQNSCLQECQLPSVESEAQTQETASH